jgi:hypothetical protein
MPSARALGYLEAGHEAGSHERAPQRIRKNNLCTKHIRRTAMQPASKGVGIAQLDLDTSMPQPVHLLGLIDL